MVHFCKKNTQLFIAELKVYSGQQQKKVTTHALEAQTEIWVTQTNRDVTNRRE